MEVIHTVKDRQNKLVHPHSQELWSVRKRIKRPFYNSVVTSGIDDIKKKGEDVQ